MKLTGQLPNKPIKYFFKYAMGRTYKTFAKGCCVC